MAKCTLTTFDNPFNPFTEFLDWFRFDVQMGYGTCEYLARIARDSQELSEEENDEEIERACDEIIKYDFMNIYKKVYDNDLSDDHNNSGSISKENKEIAS